MSYSNPSVSSAKAETSVRLQLLLALQGAREGKCYNIDVRDDSVIQ